MIVAAQVCDLLYHIFKRYLGGKKEKGTVTYGALTSLNCASGNYLMSFEYKTWY